MKKFTVGFITSPHMASYLRQIEHELDDYCRFIYLIPEDPAGSLELYLAYEDKVDCFVFSGRLYYYAVSESVESPKVPGYIIDEFEGDIRELLLKQLLKNRSMDLSRIYIDCALEVNNYLGLKDLLPEDSLPYFGDIVFVSIEKYLEDTLERHLYLHRTGKIDLSVTRTSVIAERLEEENLPYEYLYPVKEYILNFFMQIIYSTGKAESSDNVFAVIAVDINVYKNPDNGISMSGCIRVFLDFSRENGYDFSVQRDKGLLVILTQHKDIKSMTDNLSSSSFKESIEKVLGQKISMGIGLGYDMFQARRNGMKALDISMRKEGALYCITEANRLVGPVGCGDSMILKSFPSPELMMMSKEYHVDHLNLQKIISFARLNQSAPFTAYQLAEYLGVTVRSASRLINKIEKYGGAVSYIENSSSGRGRPRKYYTLTMSIIRSE